MKKYLILFIALIFVTAACKKAQKPFDKPAIVFAGISKDMVIDRNIKDTVLINLRYTMAAAAVGSSFETVVYLKDSRDQNLQPFSFPDEVGNNLPDGETNISGQITVQLFADRVFALRPDRPNGDTLHYDIYLEDKDGNQSNIIVTPDIYILP